MSNNINSTVTSVDKASEQLYQIRKLSAGRSISKQSSSIYPKRNIVLNGESASNSASKPAANDGIFSQESRPTQIINNMTKASEATARYRTVNDQNVTNGSSSQFQERLMNRHTESARKSGFQTLNQTKKVVLEQQDSQKQFLKQMQATPQQQPQGNKSSKRAWDDVQDMKLLKMIAEIGPHQWEHMALQMEGRSGKQCRERWHNQLNPLLKKANWTIEEDWILYILHQTVKNRWAEITNVLLGRSDNSIKNYWNSTLRQKQGLLEADLNAYLKQAVYDVSEPSAIAKQKQQVMQSLLQHYISVAQIQYFDYIRAKIENLKLEPVEFALSSATGDEMMDLVTSCSKINQFKIKLLEHALMPEDELQRLYDPNSSSSNTAANTQTSNNQQSTQLTTAYAASSTIPHNNPETNNSNSSATSMPKLKAMLELRELKQFHKVFLQNQLCKNLQNAMADLKARNSYQNVQMVAAARQMQHSTLISVDGALQYEQVLIDQQSLQQPQQQQQQCAVGQAPSQGGIAGQIPIAAAIVAAGDSKQEPVSVAAESHQISADMLSGSSAPNNQIQEAVAEGCDDNFEVNVAVDLCKRSVLATPIVTSDQYQYQQKNLLKNSGDGAINALYHSKTPQASTTVCDNQTAREQDQKSSSSNDNLKDQQQQQFQSSCVGGGHHHSISSKRAAKLLTKKLVAMSASSDINKPAAAQSMASELEQTASGDGQLISKLNCSPQNYADVDKNLQQLQKKQNNKMMQFDNIIIAKKTAITPPIQSSSLSPSNEHAAAAVPQKNAALNNGASKNTNKTLQSANTGENLSIINNITNNYIYLNKKQVGERVIAQSTVSDQNHASSEQQRPLKKFDEICQHNNNCEISGKQIKEYYQKQEAKPLLSYQNQQKHESAAKTTEQNEQHSEHQMQSKLISKQFQDGKKKSIHNIKHTILTEDKHGQKSMPRTSEAINTQLVVAQFSGLKRVHRNSKRSSHKQSIRRQQRSGPGQQNTTTLRFLPEMSTTPTFNHHHQHHYHHYTASTEHPHASMMSSTSHYCNCYWCLSGSSSAPSQAPYQAGMYQSQHMMVQYDASSGYYPSPAATPGFGGVSCTGPCCIPSNANQTATYSPSQFNTNGLQPSMPMLTNYPSASPDFYTSTALQPHHYQQMQYEECMMQSQHYPKHALPNNAVRQYHNVNKTSSKIKKQSTANKARAFNKKVEVIVEQYDDNNVIEDQLFVNDNNVQEEQPEEAQPINDYLSLALVASPHAQQQKQQAAPQYQTSWCLPSKTSYSISARSLQNINNPHPSGLTMSIAEKPKSQEMLAVNKLPNRAMPCQMITESEMMQEQADNGGQLSWQDYGNQSNLAVCPSNQFLAYSINEMSEQAHCHMNTFANTTKFDKQKQMQDKMSNEMIEEAAADGVNQSSQIDQVAKSFAEREESSHLGSELDTYQCVMTPAAVTKRRRHF